MKKIFVLLISTLFLYACGSQLEKQEENFTINKTIKNEIKESFLISEKGKSVILSNLTENQVITLPFLLIGEVPTNWVFEGVFPLEIQDKEGNTLYQSHGNANIFDESGEVILPNVSFESFIDFSLEAEGEGKLILKADNPSGLEEHSDKVEISITLKKREESE